VTASRPGRAIRRAGTLERGMVTAELAVALPALVLVLTVALGALTLAVDQVRCVDAARVGARLLVRGEDPGLVRDVIARHAPSRARVDLEVSASAVRVAVAAEPPRVLRVLGLRARAGGVAEGVPETAP